MAIDAVEDESEGDMTLELGWEFEAPSVGPLLIAAVTNSASVIDCVEMLIECG